MTDGSLILMRVTAVDYETENGDVIVQLAGRDEHGDRRTLKVEDTVPYFYVREDESHRIADHAAVRKVREGYHSFDGVPLARIDVAVPSNAGDRGSEENLTKKFEDTWESDIPYYRRVSIDYNLSGHIRVPDTKRCSINDIDTEVTVQGADEIEPRLLLADIEVLPREGESFDEMTEEYEAPITHISMWDSYEDEYIALHLDPEGKVNPQDVKKHLQNQADDEVGEPGMGQVASQEISRDIHLRSYDTPEALANAFISTIQERRPDLVSGWNFVDFDWDYILNWFNNLDDVNYHGLSDIGIVSGYNTERRVDCLPAFDMMDAYKKMTTPAGDKKRSYALDYIGKEVLGVGKVQNVSIIEDYDSRRDLLVAYNIFDTMLTVALDRREDIHSFFYELAELSQVQIYDTFSEMRLIDGYIMSRAGDDEILPPQQDADFPENEGGLVLDPSDGVKDWIGVLDLTSLYPSDMITWNISTETTYWYDEKEPEGEYINIPWVPSDRGDFDQSDVRFDVMWSDLSTEGIIPKYLKRLFPQRDERKAERDQYDPGDDLYDVWDRKQYAVKVLMNSFYGVSSNDHWRLGKHGLGDAITSAARYTLWQGKEIAEDEGFHVHYGDTDSIMIQLVSPEKGKEAALTRGEELEERVNSGIDICVEKSGLPDGPHPLITDELHGTDRHALEYEFEKLYRRFFQAGTKKRYAGLTVWKEGKDVDGDIDMVGFESRRSDSPELTSDVQPEVIRRILTGQGFQEVSDYVRGVISDIENQEIELYKFGLPSSLGQPLHEYGNTQVARACRYSNKYLDKMWSSGDDPWVYFIESTPPMAPVMDVIALDWNDELPEGFELDMEKTLDRAAASPLKPILREVGWRWAEVKQGAQTGSAAEAGWSSADNVEEDDDGEDDGWGW